MTQRDGWHDIEGRKVTHEVKRLQTRIVKAVIEKPHVVQQGVGKP